MRDVRVLIVGFVAATAFVGAAAAVRAQTADAFEGKQKYDVYCASCHGVAGKGDGTLAASLKKPPADLDAAGPEERRKVPGRGGNQVH